MSVLYKGEVRDTALSKNAKGGTEQMRSRMLKYVDKELLAKVAIHFSRPKQIYSDVPNILYFHDLAEDPATQSLSYESHLYEHFVFVSHWQRDQFISRFSIPYSKCTVINNAIEKEFQSFIKPKDKINFIYHTTPHRGLSLLYPIFNELCKTHDNIHLDVYSSFKVYGWEERDKPYSNLFDKLQQHPHITYHGAVSNSEVLYALDKSHIFLYPCIWKETSCIALIEAMQAGCLSIYPAYAALPETGSYVSNVGMYKYTDDVQIHLSSAYMYTNHILKEQRKNDNFLSSIVNTSISQINPYSIDLYKMKWENLLMENLNGK